MKKLSKEHQEYKELQALYRKYPLIPAYSKIMGSYDYWTEQQLWAAENNNAPVDTYNMDMGSSFSKGISTPVAHRIDQIKNKGLVMELKMYARAWGYKEEEDNQ